MARKSINYRDFLFDPEGEGYDYATAEEVPGLYDPESRHWSSRDPRTGLILKGRKHKTWDLMVEEDKSLGYRISKRGDRYYSTKLVGGRDTGARPGPESLGNKALNILFRNITSGVFEKDQLTPEKQLEKILEPNPRDSIYAPPGEPTLAITKPRFLG